VVSEGFHFTVHPMWVHLATATRRFPFLSRYTAIFASPEVTMPPSPLPISDRFCVTVRADDDVDGGELGDLLGTEPRMNAFAPVSPLFRR